MHSGSLLATAGVRPAAALHWATSVETAGGWLDAMFSTAADGETCRLPMAAGSLLSICSSAKPDHGTRTIRVRWFRRDALHMLKWFLGIAAAAFMTTAGAAMPVQLSNMPVDAMLTRVQLVCTPSSCIDQRTGQYTESHCDRRGCRPLGGVVGRVT